MGCAAELTCSTVFGAKIAPIFSSVESLSVKINELDREFLDTFAHEEAQLLRVAELNRQLRYSVHAI